MPSTCRSIRLLKNAHLPFDRLMALSKAEGLRCPPPSSLRRTGLYVSFLGLSGALYLSVFEQPTSRAFLSALQEVLELRVSGI